MTRTAAAGPSFAPLAPRFCDNADLEAAKFGSHSFRGDVATKYLAKYGESAALLATAAWTATKSDVVASAMLDWAKDNGASVYCHWFQPMGARPKGGCAVRRARWLLCMRRAPPKSHASLHRRLRLPPRPDGSALQHHD